MTEALVQVENGQTNTQALWKPVDFFTLSEVRKQGNFLLPPRWNTTLSVLYFKW